jgi:two-component system chemotaxis response regulator CheY
LEQVVQDRIEFAVTGQEAIEKFKTLADKPELIIMDHRMPMMSGMEAMIEILKIDNNAKIIFLSADNTMKEEALSKGALRFFTKPMDIKYFIAVVKELLGNNNGSI